jgi:hypothetical protein
MVAGMSSADTKTLIEQAVKNLQADVPALDNLKLVVGLELRGRGDVQLYRVEVPGPKISKDVRGDERIRLSVPRADFNELVADGHLREWRKAFETGHAKASGPPEILQLIERVVVKQEERSRTRKARG